MATPDRTTLTRWNDLVKNHQKMEREILTILRHPEATPEMIEDVRQKYADAHKRMHEMHHKVERLFWGRLFEPRKPSLTDL